MKFFSRRCRWVPAALGLALAAAACVIPTDAERDDRGSNPPSSSPPPSQSNPYGAGNGKITFWTNVPDGGNTSLYLNGQYVGQLSQYFTGDGPNCDASSGVVSVIRAAGTHSFSARDQSGRTWSGTIPLQSGQCTRWLLYTSR